MLLSAAAFAAAESKCPCTVEFKLGLNGVSDTPIAQTVTPGGKPTQIPEVKSIREGYEFVGWSLTDPAELKAGEEAELVDPAKTKISEGTVFYAVYKTPEHTVADHLHYVIGYPTGYFGPGDNITRGEVATIIARACLEGFREGADYGNPGQFSDVESHWAYSAISYCVMHDVFNGYEDGTFRPSQPITRQELAVTVARLAGVKEGADLPFSDVEDIGDWAVSGVYTAYDNGWVNGYEDGTFKPLNNIRRDETVKVFNGYLNRGVDKEGLKALTAYVPATDGQHAAHADGDNSHYLAWPDVPESHWAYYEIVEAANDHTFYYRDEEAKVPPEDWTAAYVDEKWYYHDGAEPAREGDTQTTTE